MSKEFSEKEKADIMLLFSKGVSLKKIGKHFNTSANTIHKKLEEWESYMIRLIYYRVKCKMCGKSFLTKSHRSIYCHNPCHSHYDPEKVQLRVEKEIIIKEIRDKFWYVAKTNPYDALSIVKKMRKEEGVSFTNIALNGIIKSDEFKELKYAYDKYVGESNDSQR